MIENNQNDLNDSQLSDKTMLDNDASNTEVKDSTLSKNTEANNGLDNLQTKDIGTIKSEFASKISEIKSHYENIIAEISAEKNSIEEQYKTSLIKQDLQRRNVNVELVYTIMKGRGDLEHIKYKSGTIEGIDEVISSYKKDENIAPLFATKTEDTSDNSNNVYNKILKTKPLNTNTNENKFEKEKNRICSDWCSKK